MAKYVKQDKQNLTIPVMPYHLNGIEDALTTLNKAFISASYNNSILKLTRMDGTTVSFDLSTTGGSEEGNVAVEFNLVQGAWVANGYASEHNNRVCTEALIPGNFYVRVNDGYVIRAVYAYSTPTSSSSASMPGDTSETRTEFTSADSTLYYGVTFAKTNSADTITPDEDIVAEWYVVE